MDGNDGKLVTNVWRCASFLGLTSTPFISMLGSKDNLADVIDRTGITWPVYSNGIIRTLYTREVWFNSPDAT